MKNIDPTKSITDVVIFDGASNLQLGGDILNIYYPKLTVMNWVEHTISILLNDFSKIPVVNQMVQDHNAVYNLFGSGIYHKPHSIFNQNIMDFIILMLACSVGEILEWSDISW